MAVRLASLVTMPRSQRPARTYTTDALTRTVRIAALVAAVAVAGWVLLLYPAMPQTVPTHFDVTGTPDAWGDKSSVLALVAVSVVLPAALGWLSTKPRWFNLPVPITEENAQRLYREGERMLVWMMVPIVALFAGIALSLVGMPVAPLPWIGGAGMLAVLAVGIVRMLRAA